MVHLQTFQLGPKKFVFCQVLSSIFIIIFPLRGKLCLYIYWHESGKNCISTILRSRWQNAIKSFFRLNPETLCKNRLYSLPLIETQVIDQYKEKRRTFFEIGENLV